MSFRVNDLLPQPPSHQGPNWPSEDFQGLCPTRRPSSTLLDPLVTAPQVCACSVATRQRLASTVHTRFCPHSGSLVAARQICALPFTAAHRALLACPLAALTPSLVLRWHFARLAPAPCLTMRPRLQRLGFLSCAFLSPASELDAGGTLSQGRCSACGQSYDGAPFLSHASMPDSAREFNFPCINW